MRGADALADFGGRETRGVLCSGFGDSIRMVTHYDVTRDDVGVALEALRQVLKEA